MMVVVISAVTMLLLAILMAVVLGWAKNAFHVEVDPRVEKINDVLPQVNCGACGYAGCNEYSEAVVAGEAPPNQCPVGGHECAEAIAEVLGIEIEQTFPNRPLVHCGASEENRLQRNDYSGEQTCTAATGVAGVQGCMYGCLGFGDCVVSCDYDAIHIIDGLAVVDYEKCVGCAACAKACPRNIIEMVSFTADDMLKVACSNKDGGKAVKSVCEVGCIACKRCAKESANFSVEDDLAAIDYESYDPQNLESDNNAMEKCPTNCIFMAGKNHPRGAAPSESES